MMRWGEGARAAPSAKQASTSAAVLMMRWTSPSPLQDRARSVSLWRKGGNGAKDVELGRIGPVTKSVSLEVASAHP